MLSTILVYVSLFLQVAAAVIAISLFKRTKFNASWILISVGFLLMVVSRVFDLWPTIYPEMEDELAIVQKILAFIIALVLLIGVFYIRKIFQFMRRVDEIRRESEKRVLAAVIRTEEQEKIKQNLRQAVDEAISGVRDISANISPHILNNFGLKDAVEAFIKRMRQADNFKVYFTTNLENQRFNYNIEVVVYRVICELINNTLRHAAASKVTIDLQLEEGILYLEYTDNGIGFDVNRISGHTGMGLDNMRYRLQSGNGDIEIVSEHGKGMRANAFIKVF